MNQLASLIAPNMQSIRMNPEQHPGHDLKGAGVLVGPQSEGGLCVNNTNTAPNKLVTPQATGIV